MTSNTLREMLVKHEPRSSSVCYVCSATRAEYSVFIRPVGDNPFFPFLEHHQPPEGAENIRPDSSVPACTVCYGLLLQQWDIHEKKKIPYSRRMYFLKRLDGGPFAGMDLNLQQDYESFFDSGEAESRRHRHSRSQGSIDMDVKSNENMDSRCSSSFSVSPQAHKNPSQSTSSSVLDLSVPAKIITNEPVVSSTEACFTCGQDARTLVSVFTKYNQSYPFFPNLITYPKSPKARPADSAGRISVCTQCHISLLDQWEYYQRKNVPVHERKYVLKSTAINDIQRKEKPFPKNDSSKIKSFVCYTCGMLSQLSVQRTLSAYSENDGEPFFSFLLNITPHPGASKLSNGKVSVCTLCYKSLLRQFRVFEVSNTAENLRSYKILNEAVFNGSSAPDESRRQCYLCDIVSDALVLVQSDPCDDMYFPFFKSLPRSANAIPIDHHGQVHVCKQCQVLLSFQWQAFEHAAIPIKQRQYKIPEAKLQHMSEHHQVSSSSSSSDAIPEEQKFPVSNPSVGSICNLCENPLNLDNACYLETSPKDKCMFFPSVRSLVKLGAGTDPFGRVLACSRCFLILKNQWDVFEAAQVPHSQRQYEIFRQNLDRGMGPSFSNSSSVPDASAALHIQVSSPDLKLDLSKASTSNMEPLLTTVNTLPISTITSTNASMNSDTIHSGKISTDDPVPRIRGPLDIGFVRPLVLVPINCFVCGELNTNGVTYSIRSMPDKSAEDAPFFPFLAKHTIPEGAEKLSPEGNALVCMFCHCSLISQWLAYESSPYSEDKNRFSRRYNTHNYVCFICGITTYRKRVFSTAVKEFPFLTEHKRPSGALTLHNGECVVTCQMCFESLTLQWKDYERMNLPIEMRKYNWITIPPPPDDENSKGCHVLEAAPTAGDSMTDSYNEDTGVPHAIKPNAHLPVPVVPYGGPKTLNRNTVSPVHQSGGGHGNTAFSPYGGNLNSALNATRTSSFAAALRKLAKAVDPVCEKDLSSISPASSPASGQLANLSRHHPNVPLYLNNHNPPGHGSRHSSPSPASMQPTPGKALDLGRYAMSGRNSNGVEPVSLKVESSKHISSSSDKRNESSASNKNLVSSTMPHGYRQDHSRGFQPYRNSEELRSTPPQLYNSSTSPPGSIPGYPYHHSAAQAPRMPSQNYRLEEAAYMERFGLIRPSALPYPPPPSMIPHPSRGSMHPSSQYPPELISRHAPPSGNPYQRYIQEEERQKDADVRQREIKAYREAIDHRIEDREPEYTRKERIHYRQISPPQSRTVTRGEIPDEKSYMGSITQGTPRDYMRSMSPPSSSSPLNLATSSPHSENSSHSSGYQYKDEYAKYAKHNNIAQNGHQRPNNIVNNHGYWKDDEIYNVQYHQMMLDSERKSQMQPEPMDIKPQVHPPLKPPSAYYTDPQDNRKPTYETRTLSIASVINSQINGIFAREKFASNKNPDFLKSFAFNSEASSLSESQNSKSDQDFRAKLYPGQPTKLIKTEKPPPERKVIAQQYAPRYGDNVDQFSRIAPPRDISVARTLLQGDSVKQEVIRSKLDLREERLKKKRLASEISDLDEMEFDSEEENAEKLKKLLTIRKGPDEKVELDPNQMNFLSQFELTTHAKKQALEIKKCIKRRQILHERTPSPEPEKPINNDNDFTSEYETRHLEELSCRLRCEENLQEKSNYLQSLDLKFLTEKEKSEQSRIRKIVHEEKLIRKGLLDYNHWNLDNLSVLNKKRGLSILNGLKHNPLKKNYSMIQDENSNPESLRPMFGRIPIPKVTNPLPAIPKLSSFLKPRPRLGNYSIPPPLIPCSQVVTQDSEARVTPKDSHVKDLKGFAQEFHNSVLHETKMKIEKKALSGHSSSKPLVSDENSNNSATSTKPPAPWLGIEAIMESYEYYLSEHTSEKEFLLDNIQKLKSAQQESNSKLECLSRNKEELLNEKQRLTSESRELHNNIEYLKLFIERFR